MSEDAKESFAQALTRLAEMTNWFAARCGPGESFTREMERMVLADWDEQIVPRLHTLPAELRQRIEGDCIPMMEQVRAKRRMLFCGELYHAVEARLSWLVAEAMAVLPAHMGKIQEHADPEILAMMKASAKVLLGCEFDPASIYHATDRQSEEAEAEWKRQRAVLRCDWPEDFTPELEAQVLEAIMPELYLWMQRLLAEIEEIQERYPEYRT